MSTIIDNTIFELLPPPSYGQFKKIRSAPKITFQSKAGYKHQREAYPQAKYQFKHGWNALTVAQYNTLVAWLDFAGSNAFYYIVPDTEYFAGMSMETRIVRIVEDSVEINIVNRELYSATLTLEDL